MPPFHDLDLQTNSSPHWLPYQSVVDVFVVSRWASFSEMSYFAKFQITRMQPTTESNTALNFIIPRAYGISPPSFFWTVLPYIRSAGQVIDVAPGRFVLLSLEPRTLMLIAGSHVRYCECSCARVIMWVGKLASHYNLEKKKTHRVSLESS